MANAEGLRALAGCLGAVQAALTAETLLEECRLPRNLWQQMSARLIVLSTWSKIEPDDADAYHRGFTDGCSIGATALNDLMRWLIDEMVTMIGTRSTCEQPVELKEKENHVMERSSQRN